MRSRGCPGSAPPWGYGSGSAAWTAAACPRGPWPAAGQGPRGHAAAVHAADPDPYPHGGADPGHPRLRIQAGHLLDWPARLLRPRKESAVSPDDAINPASPPGPPRGSQTFSDSRGHRLDVSWDADAARARVRVDYFDQ